MNIFALLLFTFNCLLLSLGQECGQVRYGTGLIINGTEVKRGEFPFLVGIKTKEDQAYICGGSLITKSHALTASHCIHEKYRTTRRRPDDIVAVVGKYDLRQANENGAFEMRIIEIIVHEDWDPNVERYDADIAILVFEKEVQISNFINIVCLPKYFRSNSLESGEVVGWGVSERTRISENEVIPRKVKIGKPPSNENCFYDESYLAQLSSERTYCAGGKNAGPCFGDSGGGFYVRTSSGWHIQGLVSATVLTTNYTCDSGKYALYTNVAKFYDWIWGKITKINFIQLPCYFDVAEKLKDKPYKCTGQISILSDDNNIISTIGNHLPDKSNNDVGLLDLNSKHNKKVGDILYIPDGLGKLFPKLKILYIQNCKLKSLARKNFKNMDQLSTISLSKNQIEHIDPDTFYDVPMLFSLRLNGNKLRSLQNDLFLLTPRLQYVILSNNLLEIFDSIIIGRSKGMKSLDLSYNELKTIFIEFSEFKDIQLVDLRGNQCINEIYFTSKSLKDFQDSIKKNCSKNF
ncbi:uncharacterized protein [Chironomus tepperi]|uniref:uncharacterized protein n=1 Tax=Chironomus tepperi TaxID=113505 RepID=UPI00391F3EBA